MGNDINRKTTHEYWENVHGRTSPRLRVPSALAVPTRNLQTLLKKHINPGMEVLEIGFAPGKQLSYVASHYDARVSGVDFSDSGIAFAKRLFETIDIDADLRCEDVFNTSFNDGSFDVVYSVGVVEHFDDPTEIIRKHVELLKPGGTAVITIPNYGGFYAHHQAKVDPENLAIHNLDIMSCAAMEKLAPADLVSSSHAFLHGNMTPGLVSLSKRCRGRICRIFYRIFNNIGFIQPFKIPALCPMIVLEMRRA